MSSFRPDHILNRNVQHQIEANETRYYSSFRPSYVLNRDDERQIELGRMRAYRQDQLSMAEKVALANDRTAPMLPRNIIPGVAVVEPIHLSSVSNSPRLSRRARIWRRMCCC